MKQCHDCPYLKAVSGDTVISTMNEEDLKIFPHLGININPRNAQACHNHPLRECEGHIKHMINGICVNEIVEPGKIKVELL